MTDTITVEAGGWGGWTIPYVPIDVSLNDVDLRVVFGGGVAPHGRARGTLGIDGGSLGLGVDLPFADTGFTLAYDTAAGGRPPSLASLVAFVTDGWALPAPLDTFADELTIQTFEVTVAEHASSVSAAIHLPGFTWHPGGAAGIGLQGVTLTFRIATGAGASGTLAGTLVLGQGALPLVATMQKSWSTYSVALAPGQIGTLPALGDIAALFDARFAAALPSWLSSLGHGIDLTAFSVSVAGEAWSLDATVGTAATWSQTLFPGVLKLTEAGLTFARPTTGPATGEATVAAQVLGVDVTFALTLPDPALTATIAAGDLSLGRLCQAAVGQPLPAGIPDLGLGEVALRLEGRSSTFTIDAALTGTIAFPGGEVDDLSVRVVLQPGKDPSLCLHGTLKIAGASTTGTLCYPFKQFCPDGGAPCSDYPPPQPTPQPPGGGGGGGGSGGGSGGHSGGGSGGGSGLSPGTIASIIAGAASLVAGAIAAAAAGATAAQTAAAALQAGDSIADVVAALTKAYPALQATGVAEALQSALTSLARAPEAAPGMAGALAGAGWAANAVAPALKASCAAAAPAAATALQGAYPSLPASGMAQALAHGPYDVVGSAAALQATFPPTVIGTATVLAGLVMQAGFVPAPDAPTLAHALSAFPLPDLVAGLVSALPAVDAAAVAAALASIGTPIDRTAPVLRASAVGATVSTPAGMAATLVTAYPGTRAEALVAVLAAGGWRPFEAVSAAMIAPTAAQTPGEFAQMLARVYGSPGYPPSPLLLATGLMATNPSAELLAAGLEAVWPGFPVNGAIVSMLTAPGLPDTTIPPIFPNLMPSAVKARSLNQTQPTMALNLAGGVPVGILVATLVATLDAISPHDLAGSVLSAGVPYALDDVAVALALAHPQVPEVDLLVPLLQFAPQPVSPPDLARAVVAMASVAGSSGDAGPAATALAANLIAAYAAIGRTLGVDDLVPALWQAGLQGLSADDVVQALVRTLPEGSLWPATLAVAFVDGAQLPASALVQVLVDQFGLSSTFAGTAVLIGALRAAGVDQATAAPLIQSTYAHGWNENGDMLLATYDDPKWDAGYRHLLQAGRTPSDYVELYPFDQNSLYTVAAVMIGIWMMLDPVAAAPTLANTLALSGTIGVANGVIAVYRIYDNQWTDAARQALVAAWPPDPFPDG